MICVYKIKKHVLESLLEASRNTYPNEFFALLGGDREKKVIDEFIITPAVYGKRHALYWPHLAPIDSKVMGSVHSHPSRSGTPSGADVRGFARSGEIHLIIFYPFGAKDFRAFNALGEEAEIKTT
ncbi:MAG: Mov34/MPN/PAD-1 family protein [Candidatus Diapherotrites archaeon]